MIFNFFISFSGCVVPYRQRAHVLTTAVAQNQHNNRTNIREIVKMVNCGSGTTEPNRTHNTINGTIASQSIINILEHKNE